MINSGETAYDTFVTAISGSNDSISTEKTIVIDATATNIPGGTFSVQLRVYNSKIAHVLHDSSISVTVEAIACQQTTVEDDYPA